MRFPEMVKSQLMSAAPDGSLAYSGDLSVCDPGVLWFDPFEVIHWAWTPDSGGLWT